MTLFGDVNQLSSMIRLRIIMHRGAAALDPFRPHGKASFPGIDMESSHVQYALRKIIDRLRKNHRPTYVGELSIAAGVSLERTERLLDHLQGLGAVRFLRQDEKKNLGLDVMGFIVILIDETLIPRLER